MIRNKFNLLVAVSLFVSSCSQTSGDKKESPAKEVAKDRDVVTEPEPTAIACWDKLLKTPAVLACAGIYSHSAKVCVTASLTKESNCSREAIAAKYGSATLNGQPVMTSVDQWIADGYAPDQCAIGSDSKLYIYFLKKVFNPKSTDSGGDQYSIADKRLGPAGAILNSITLSTATASTEFSCD